MTETRAYQAQRDRMRRHTRLHMHTRRRQDAHSSFQGTCTVLTHRCYSGVTYKCKDEAGMRHAVVCMSAVLVQEGELTTERGVTCGRDDTFPGWCKTSRHTRYVQTVRRSCWSASAKHKMIAIACQVCGLLCRCGTIQLVKVVVHQEA